MGGVLGVLLAIAAMPLLRAAGSHTMPIPKRPALDSACWRSPPWSTLATGIAFGVLPALRADRRADPAALRDGARSGRRAQHRTRSRDTGHGGDRGVGRAAGRLPGLLVRALWRVQQIDPGFRAENVLTLRTSLPAAEVRETARRQDFYDRVLGEVRALPGVTGAAYISYLPMVMRGGIWPVILDFGTPERRGASELVAGSIRDAHGQLPRGDSGVLRDDGHPDRCRAATSADSGHAATRPGRGRQPVIRRSATGRDRTRSAASSSSPSANALWLASSAPFASAGSSARASRRSTFRSRQVPDGGLGFYAPQKTWS